MGSKRLPPLLTRRVSPASARPPSTSSSSSKCNPPVGRSPSVVVFPNPPTPTNFYSPPPPPPPSLLIIASHHRAPPYLPALLLFPSMASPVDGTASSSSSAVPQAPPLTPPASPPLSLSSPPDEMYTMPFLPPLSPLSSTPPYSCYRLHEISQHSEDFHQHQHSLFDYPLCPSPAPAPPLGDLSYSGEFPFFPTTFAEGFGDEECYHWNGEDLSWSDMYGTAAIGDFLQREEVGGVGSEAAVVPLKDNKPATETETGGNGGGAFILPQQHQVGCLALQMQQWSGMAKAARSKRRIARQMSNCAVPRFVLPRRGSSSSSSSSSMPNGASAPAVRSRRRTACGFSTMAAKKPPATRPPMTLLFPPVQMVGSSH